MSRRDFTATTHSTSYEYISPLNLDLSGRSALVTGAAWEDGVGYAVACAMARSGVSSIAMMDVHAIPTVLIDRLQALALSAGRAEPSVMTLAVDISDLDQVQTALDAVRLAFGGRLDILINNAAYQEPYKPILASTPAIDWRTWEVNMHGLMNMTRASLPMLLESKAKHDGLCTLINVSSSGALSARSGSSNYRSSKLAILRWTEILQLDYEAQGLLAFCVNPGAIRTRMTCNEPEGVRRLLPHHPEIAGDTITWLAATRKDWLGGRYVSCPWDMRELMDRKVEIVEGDKLKMKMVF